MRIYNLFIFNDIRKEDIVIDIGACIGAFCIPASKLSDNVYAVEPITIKELKQNIILNQANIDVIETALGNGEIMEIEWQEKAKKIKTMAFSEILSLCGGCDFLKCDCEGGEWFIKPNEIRNIRRIEMEYHRHNVSGNNKRELLDALSEYFEITIDKWEKPVNGLGIIHAKNRNIK